MTNDPSLWDGLRILIQEQIKSPHTHALSPCPFSLQFVAPRQSLNRHFFF